MNTTYPDIEQALTEISDFLFSGNKEHILQGGAGTGKSTLINKLIHEVLPNIRIVAKSLDIPLPLEVALTATTNSATALLEEISNNISAKTIHSFLGITLTPNYKTGDNDLNLSRLRSVTNTFIIIDEASMIDETLHRILIDHTPNCKILYVGDWKQMLAVKGNWKNVHLIPKSELSIIKRTSNPHLASLYKELATAVTTNKLNRISLVPNVIDYFDETEVVNFLKNNIGTFAIGTYTNQEAVNINNYVRKNILGYTDYYNKGEIVIINSSDRDGIFKTDEVVTINRKVKEESFIDIPKLPSNIPTGFNLNDLNFPVVTYEISLLTKRSVNIGTIVTPKYPENLIRILKKCAAMKAWALYFFIKNNLVDIRPRYAATCYKLQGRTIDTIMLSLGDITSCRQSTNIFRMLYVGATRAKNRLIFFGTPNAKYSHII